MTREYIVKAEIVDAYQMFYTRKQTPDSWPTWVKNVCGWREGRLFLLPDSCTREVIRINDWLVRKKDGSVCLVRTRAFKLFFQERKAMPPKPDMGTDRVTVPTSLIKAIKEYNEAKKGLRDSKLSLAEANRRAEEALATLEIQKNTHMEVLSKYVSVFGVEA